MKDLPCIECRTRKDLRDWLAKHHQSQHSVWLVYFKPSTGLGDITYSTLVDELLCYGWIDSLPRKVDEKRTAIRISPRHPKSNWSKVNKAKVAHLTKAGKMQAPGLALVKIAQLNGTWDALDDVENLVVPYELAQALKKHRLTKIWHNVSRSKKRGWLEQLHIAKLPHTKQKRITAIINYLLKPI